MSSRDLPIYISTSNDYLKVLRISLWLFKEYWPEFSEYSVNILGYEEPDYNLPNNVKFISMGPQVGGPAMWSTDLRKFFMHAEDMFIYMMDDMFINAPLDQKIVDIFKDLMLKEKNIVRASLVNDPGPFSTAYEFCQIEGHNIVQLSQQANYRNSTQPSIWKKDYLLNFLEPGLTPWQFEIKGMEKAKNDGKTVIGTAGVYAMHAYEGVRIPPRGLGPKFPNLSQLPHDCISKMKNEGIV